MCHSAKYIATRNDYQHMLIRNSVRASSVKTPQPTPTSLSSLQSSTPTGTRQRVSVLRQSCLIRDRHRCVVSRRFDRAVARKRFAEYGESCADDDGKLLKHETSDRFQYLEVAHILPHCLTTVASGDADLVSSNIRAVISTVLIWCLERFKEKCSPDFGYVRPRNRSPY